MIFPDSDSKQPAANDVGLQAELWGVQARWWQGRREARGQGRVT